jgi:Asp-tRNA(Asn)/Glu-tRNA(Gln) amidotransferase A subunit family amidase
VPIDGVYPLNGTYRDVAGPIAKTVYDAAAVLDAVSGISKRDRLTFDAEVYPNGYTSKLSTSALQGTKIGYWDPAFNLSNVANNPPTAPFVPQSLALYETAISTITGQGATIDRSRYLDDNGYDEFFRTIGSEPSASQFDVDQYLQALGPDANFNSIAEYNALIRAKYNNNPPAGSSAPSRRPTTRRPTRSRATTSSRTSRSATSSASCSSRSSTTPGSTPLVFPVHTLPIVNLNDTNRNIGTVSGAVNVLGIPGVMVNAGYFSGDADGDGDDDTGDPFGLIFLGRRFDEADLLSYAYAYEQASMTRMAPTLVPEPPASAFWRLRPARCGSGGGGTPRRRAARRALGTESSWPTDLASVGLFVARGKLGMEQWLDVGFRGSRQHVRAARRLRAVPRIECRGNSEPPV